MGEILANVFQIDILLLILLGVVIGNVFGCIPGLNAPIAVALALPLTFIMTTNQAIALIMGLYMGCVSGGLVSAVLLRIPGTASNVATCFDGYPLAQQGRATDALSYGAFASFFGGIFSSICLLIMAPWLSNLAIGFGPWEYFGTAVMSLVIVCVMMGNRMLKGLISVCIGLLLKTVGVSPVDGVAMRYTFGLDSLANGFDLVVVIIGVFAISEVIKQISKIAVKPKLMEVKKKKFYFPSFATIKRNIKVMIFSSFLGTFIGILPGMGGGAASLISYEQTKKMSKTPEKFGTGCEEGIFSCESANNATTGGALIPMLALGVPGDTVTAIIMGALMLQGITPGPYFSMQNQVLFSSIILIVFIANIFMFLYQSSTIGFMAKITKLPKYLLFPIITLFCMAGTISIRNNVFDLIYLVAFGIIGYVLDNNDYPIAPFILANVLGAVVEGNLRRAITYYEDFWGCLQVPSIGTLFFAIAVILPIIKITRDILKKRKAGKEVTNG